MHSVELIKKLHEDKGLSPIQKMELIQSINKSITREVDLYYQRNTAALLPFTELLDRIPSVKANKIVLDADQLLLITVWILWQSKIAITSLYSHINLIYEFSTDSQKLSSLGYCVSSLEVCLESMLKENDPEEGKIDSTSNYSSIFRKSQLYQGTHSSQNEVNYMNTGSEGDTGGNAGLSQIEEGFDEGNNEMFDSMLEKK